MTRFEDVDSEEVDGVDGVSEVRLELSLDFRLELRLDFRLDVEDLDLVVVADVIFDETVVVMPLSLVLTMTLSVSVSMDPSALVVVHVVV